MSSPARTLALLDLFTLERPIWSTDEINATLGYARPTGYRYVKELVEAGLLRKISAGNYGLGPRIIQLDFQIRHTDPVLRASVPVMEDLVVATGFDAVLSAMFGDRLIDIHRSSSGGEALQLRYGRGRPRPLFHGAVAKIIAAYLPTAQQVALYAGFHAEAAAAGLGPDLPTYRANLTRIRKAGFYRSLGELDAGVGGAAVAVLGPGGDAVAGLALVGSVAAMRDADPAFLDAMLGGAVTVIRERLTAPDDSQP